MDMDLEGMGINALKWECFREKGFESIKDKSIKHMGCLETFQNIEWKNYGLNEGLTWVDF